MPTHEVARRRIRDHILADEGQVKATAQEAKMSEQQTRTESGRIQATPVGTARRTERYSFLLEVERPPISAIDDNPALKEDAAARLLGLSNETVKKWRQRGIGPNYIQYGPDGPVRYFLNDLLEFRNAHIIKTRPMQEKIKIRRSSRSKSR